MEQSRVKAIEEILLAERDALEEEAKPLRERLGQIDQELNELAAAADTLGCDWDWESERRRQEGPLQTVLTPEIGMTAAVRKVLREHAGQDLIPTQIRDMLVQAGLKLEGRSNPM